MIMPLPPSNGKTVLVTGINGYIASVLGLHILSKGYNLRGTTRCKDDAVTLLNGAYSRYAARVELVEVADMMAPGAFGKAVKGAQAICHTASPTRASPQSREEWIAPAVEGCSELLNSAIAHAGSQLESVIFLSSLAVGIDPRQSHNKTSIHDRPFGIAEAQRRGMQPETIAGLLYRDSKTSAEKRFWQWKDQNQPSFSICSICPGVVTGPPVRLPADTNALSSSLQPVWGLMSGQFQEVPPSTGLKDYVDVRDVAKTHLWCMEHPDQISDQRYIVSAGLGTPQAVADILREKYPERRPIIPRGRPGQGYRPDYGFYNQNRRGRGTEAVEVMDLEYTAYDKSIRDTAQALECYC